METNLKEQLERRRKVFAEKAEPGWVETMEAATEELRESGAAERAPEVGEQAPDFTLSDVEGRERTLSEILEQRPVLLSFYRGRW